MPSVPTYTELQPSQPIIANNHTSNYVPIQQTFVQSNRGLQEALSCADRSHLVYLAAVKSHTLGGGNFAPNPEPGCHVDMSWYDANMIKSSIPVHIVDGFIYQIQYQGKYYWLTLGLL
jgi:hypothetical protein